MGEEGLYPGVGLCPQGDPLPLWTEYMTDASKKTLPCPKLQGQSDTHHGEVAYFVGDGAAVVIVVQRVRFTHRHRVVKRAHLLYVF